MNLTVALENSSRGQDRLGRGLIWLAALGAFAAFASAFAGISSATPETLWARREPSRHN
jgi:hypothetical protein